MVAVFSLMHTSISCFLKLLANHSALSLHAIDFFELKVVLLFILFLIFIWPFPLLRMLL